MESGKGVENAQDNVKKKRKRVSKKSKRSWRKHVDITEIEEHLDEVRRQERTGGVISLKRSEELFYVDKDNDEIENEAGESKVSKVLTGKKRKLKKDDNSDESSDDEARTAAIKNRKNRTQKTGVYDLWASTSNDNSKEDEAVENEHYLKMTKKKAVKQPKTAYKVRSTAPALAVCHPGASYNPTFEDHQTLLHAACEVEIMKEKEIEKIKRQLALPSEEELAKLPSWEEEMSQGLFGEESDGEGGEDSDDGDDDESGTMLPAGGSKERKTAKEKRKANERKKEEQSSKLQRKEKVKENEVFRVKSLKKLMKKDAEKTKERQEKKQKKLVEASSKPQRLGRQKFEEMNIEIQLTDEVSGSLRNMKPEGNLFEDRFKNLQRRNIIEPRRPVMPHRKYKLKEYEKRSYKNFNLQEKLKKKKKS
ncbi:Hypothetical predicted protein [Paramuricea clavata]|uniref:Ribosome biogenesis protein NOP53 n=1 Tax=Paramuricea clavata TaxID=317549 RepID=A0A7D9HLH3_PARCT|nr:Hypothetical predicted protein [Paramuricea clavata]